MIGPGHLDEPLTISPFSPAVDRYGNESAGFGDPVPAKGFIEQNTSVEHLGDRDVVVTTQRVWLPPGTAVGRLDVITDPSGIVWQVQGDPQRIWNPRLNRESHVICILERASGG